MAEHVWFVPVSCGRGTGPTTVLPPLHPKDFNVQWDFEPLLLSPLPELACLDWTSAMSFGFQPMAGAAYLGACFARWTWRSCAQSGVIITNGQLAIGTVLSRYLPDYTPVGAPNPEPALTPISRYQWLSVEAWVKMRLPNLGPVGQVYFALNDSAGNVIGLNAAPATWLPFIPANQWMVVEAKKSGAFADWACWDSRNLRATLTVQGTANPANVGRVDVDVEWFAFRLSDEVPPH